MPHKRVSRSYYSYVNSSFWDFNKKAYLDNIKMKYPQLYRRLSKKCSIIRYDDLGPYLKKIVFIEFVDFNKELNPVIKAWYSFKINSNFEWEYSGKRNNSKTNPLILHKKELMVDNSYRGFSIDLAEEWTTYYTKSGIYDFHDTTKIGRKNFWDSCLKQLEEQNPEMYKNFMDRWEAQWKK
ncbi:MAG: hypothetical protein ACRCXX_13810 [Cetobacterium sp.]|uniref:hypothetical protein n=1 Tax=Cetobacterium sp. TaxID=2071632 RepID=UPI003F37C323